VSVAEAERPLQAAEQSVLLSLSEAVQIGLQNNSELQIEQENIVLRDAAVQIEDALFDLSFRMSADLKKSVRGSTSFAETGLTGANFFEQKEVQIGLGWAKLLRWGGTTDLTLTQQKTDASFQSTNPTFQTDLAVKWTQPLLRGFGKKIKQGPLVIAQKQHDISLLTFQSRVMDIVLKIVSLYWELIFQTENLVVQQDSLNLAKQLLELNQTKVTLGLLAPIENLVSESAIASREEAVIIAGKGVDDVEDQIENLMGLSGRILPTDRPVSDEIQQDLNDLLKSALRNRPEIAVAGGSIENSNVSVEIAESQLRPSLDFVGIIGPSGIGEHGSDAFDQLGSGGFYRWSAGLLFAVPIGNKAAAAVIRKEKSGRKKLQIEKERLIAQIQLDVREGERRVKSDFERIKATSRALALSKKQLAAGAERFHLGLLSNHDLIAFQNDVAVAEVHALRAIIDYNKSLANLYKVTGTLFEKYQIKTSSLS